MPASYSIDGKKWSITLDDPIDMQSIEIVKQKLDAGEVGYLGIGNIDLDLLFSLNLEHISSLSIGGLPCYDLGFLSSIKKLESLRLSYAPWLKVGRQIRLSTLPPMDNLTSLSLRGVRGLNDLPQLPGLQVLNLGAIVNEDLAFLKLFPAIRDLLLSECRLRGYNRLLHCMNLVRLMTIQTNPIDFAEIIADGSINKSLKILAISYCRSLTDFSFLECFPGISYMDITVCNKLASFKGLEECKNLKVVNISQCKVQDKTLRYLENIPTVLLGMRYTKKEVENFDKAFKGQVYSIGRFDKGNAHYTELYSNHYQRKLEDIPALRGS